MWSDLYTVFKMDEMKLQRCQNKGAQGITLLIVIHSIYVLTDMSNSLVTV